MRAPAVVLPDRASWYAEGLRWIGTLFTSTRVDSMPRHTSYEEIVGEVRNRIQSGFGAGQRPYY